MQNEEAAGRLVVQSNELVRRRREEMTLLENRMLLFLISAIKPEDEELKTVTFNIRDLCDICGIDARGQNYQNIRDSLKSIASKHFWLDKGDVEVLCSWIVKPTIHKNSMEVSVDLDPDTAPFLLKLRRSFTAFELRFALAMHSTYSLRMYELLKSYASIGEWLVGLDEFKELTNSGTYKDFASLRRRVIDPALKEISEKTDLIVSYRQINGAKGRTVTALCFTIGKRTIAAARARADCAILDKGAAWAQRQMDKMQEE